MPIKCCDCGKDAANVETAGNAARIRIVCSDCGRWTGWVKADDQDGLIGLWQKAEGRAWDSPPGPLPPPPG